MILIKNKKAYFDYEILEKFEAGIELFGHEVKSLKNKRGTLDGSRVIIRGGEAFVVGFDIPPYQPKNIPGNYETQRTRKLLLRKKEIKYLIGKSNVSGLTLAPLAVYNKGRLIKIEFAVVKGLKNQDKREKIKEREAKRKIERTLKL